MSSRNIQYSSFEWLHVFNAFRNRLRIFSDRIGMVFKIRIGFGLDHFGSDSDFKIYQLSDYRNFQSDPMHTFSSYRIVRKGFWHRTSTNNLHSVPPQEWDNELRKWLHNMCHLYWPPPPPVWPSAKIKSLHCRSPVLILPLLKIQIIKIPPFYKVLTPFLLITSFGDQKIDMLTLLNAAEWIPCC